MIFPEDKLKIISKMLEAALDSCPCEGEAAWQHWMAAATMVQVIIDYEEAVRPVVSYEEALRSVVGYEEESACDESEAV